MTEIDIGLPGLAWGYATLGNTGWRDIFHWNIPDISGIISKIFEISSYLKTDCDGFVTTSERYKNLVDTELQTATNRIGAAVSKCLASKILGVHHLQNVLPLIKQGIVGINAGTNRRPDYIGPDKGGSWHVIEAKGRSRYQSDLVVNAKGQAKSIAWIGGKPPKTICGCVSFTHRDPMFVEFRDPELDENEPIEIEINIDQYIRKYYAPFIDLIGLNIEFLPIEIDSPLNIGEYLAPNITSSSITIQENVRYGISSELYQLIQSSEFSYSNIVKLLEPFENGGFENETTFAGPDGTILIIQ